MTCMGRLARILTQGNFGEDVVERNSSWFCPIKLREDIQALSGGLLSDSLVLQTGQDTSVAGA